MNTNTPQFHTASPRGFTLLVAIILVSVTLSVGLALLDLAYKQVVLSSAARQSQVAFYAADAALECALYYDQQKDAFDYMPSARPALSYTCQSVSLAPQPNDVATTHTTTFTIPCAGDVTPGNAAASVTIYKTGGNGSCNGGTATTCIYATGYSSCKATDPRRIERGIKVVY